jgi:hypothetical protein
MFLATLPVLLFYLALQKQFVKGLTGGRHQGLTCVRSPRGTCSVPGGVPGDRRG